MATLSDRVTFSLFERYSLKKVLITICVASLNQYITSTITKLSPILVQQLKIWNSSIDFTATHTSSYALCMIARYLVCLKLPFKNCNTILSPAMLKMCVVKRLVSETNLKMVNFCKLGY